MGRPIRYGKGEVAGTLYRARHMIAIAGTALADVDCKDTDLPGFRRFMKKTPLGPILVIAPWNYPMLCTVNSVLPAILAGNTVILKACHPLCIDILLC